MHRRSATGPALVPALLCLGFELAVGDLSHRDGQAMGGAF
jgi:hypothetical protein